MKFYKYINIVLGLGLGLILSPQYFVKAHSGIVNNRIADMGVENNSKETLAKIDGIKNVYASSTSCHTMFIKNDRTLWGHGKNLNGQLGDTTKVNKKTPVLINIDDVKKLLLRESLL